MRVGRSTAGGADCRDVTAGDLVGGGEGGREKREDGRRWKMELKFLYFLRCLCEENCFMLVLGTGQCGHKEKMEKIRRRNEEKDGELKFMFVFEE